MAEDHAEPEAPIEATKPKRRQLIKPFEGVVIVGFTVIVVVLSVALIHKLALNRDVAAARSVSDKVIADIQARNGNAARKLGTTTFKKTYSADVLTQDFKHITIATLKAPHLDQQIVVDSDSGRTAFFIYKYTALKVPYYVRTAMVKKSGTWQLTAITGNADESALMGS